MKSIKDFVIIKDNFFEQEMYQKIINDMLGLNFSNRHTTVGKKYQNRSQKIYFNVGLDKEYFAVKEVCKILKEMGFKVEGEEHNYFLSTKHTKMTPHIDPCGLNCLVYLKGLTMLNSGTGFYEYLKEADDYIISRHIGFKENRAIIFDSKIPHASLQFNEVTGTRYIMSNFFKQIEVD